jgi:sugar diacid utilization regulator
MAASVRGINKSLLPAARTRANIAKRLAGVSGAMTTATVAEMEARHAWFRRLDAEHRSSITLVAQAGIDGFVRWFADPDPAAPSTSEVFGSAPRELARRISLAQTVELVKTTIEVVETQIDEVMPKADRPILHAAIDQYSREVAFAAAEIYARAAELRGAWDARLEALVVDAVVRGETDETVLSRASALGWRSPAAVVVVVGRAPEMDPSAALESVRHSAAIARADMLGATQGDRMIVVLGGGAGLGSDDASLQVVASFVSAFGAGPVVVGPPVDHLMDAASSTREALSGFRAAAGWPEAPRPVSAHDLLPERALAGDGHARRALARELYDPVLAAGGGLLETLITFLDCGSSVEAAARALFVHPNTVRYRLRRIHETSGYSPTDPRDAYALRLSLTLGRLTRPVPDADGSRDSTLGVANPARATEAL